MKEAIYCRQEILSIYRGKDGSKSIVDYDTLKVSVNLAKLYAAKEIRREEEAERRGEESLRELEKDEWLGKEHLETIELSEWLADIGEEKRRAEEWLKGVEDASPDEEPSSLEIEEIV